MKRAIDHYEYLKDFCLVTLIFYGIFIAVFLANTICWYLPSGIFDYFYDVLAHFSIFLLFVGGALSVIWLIIFVIWCSVICKKERSKKVFRTPIVAISLSATIVYIIFVVFTILSGF